MDFWLLWLILVLLVPVMSFFMYSLINSKKLNLPPGPPAWPLIGHLHLLSDFSHLTLARLSKSYGPLFSLRLGSVPAVVVSSSSCAREFFAAHDKTFASRPQMMIAQRIAYGIDHGVSMTPYGDRWREMRRVCTLELLTSRRLQQLQHIRVEEIKLMIDNLHERQLAGPPNAVSVAECLAALSSNVIGRMLISDRISDCRMKGGYSLKALLQETTRLFTAPVIGDYIPYLGWLDFKVRRTMDAFHDKIDKFLEGVIAEREKEREKNPKEIPRDLLDVLLSKSVTSAGEGLERDSVKGLVLDLLGAGIETSSITIEWALSELLKNPPCLKKLQQELDTFMRSSSKTMVEESDFSNLPYLNSVIKETLRLHPPIPFLIPHSSTEACNVAGYTLPKNTMLFVNAWAIGRDPQVWEKPESFWPDRFTEKDGIDVKGRHFELLPFGTGRRSCPGMGLGLLMANLTLSNLIYSFDWELPYGQSPSELDMTERNSITSSKATPLLAIPKPRQ